MTLGDKRRRFTLRISQLVVWADLQGYGLAYEDVKAHDGHMKGSMHYSGLAADLNAYIWNGRRWVWQTGSGAHEVMGPEWERMGGKWGGRYKTKGGGMDYNHYEWGIDLHEHG